MTNLQFLAFFINTIKAVDHEVLRAAMQQQVTIID
jgi:hypothetical protein